MRMQVLVSQEITQARDPRKNSDAQRQQTYPSSTSYFVALHSRRRRACHSLRPGNRSHFLDCAVASAENACFLPSPLAIL